MVKRSKRDLMMITLQKAAGLYLATIETEGKSPPFSIESKKSPPQTQGNEFKTS
jgi:hypothetical protein